jgi:hypothetical protein
MANTYGFTVDCNGNVAEQMAKIQSALTGMGTKAVVETEKATGAFHKLGESVKESFGGIKSLLLAGIGIGAAFEGIELIKESKQYFQETEEALAKVNAALASTKGIAGESAERLEDVAKALEGKVLFSGPQIADAQSMLLTFTAIRGEIYEKTLPAITDFATRFKMDLPEAANMLGKALNDPLKGMTRLQRQGVVFSASQKELIKNFMETGQIAKAQKVILGELSTEFGGLAEAMTKTSAGKMEMAKKQWDDIKLEIGAIVVKIQLALIPIIGVMSKAVRGLIEFFKSSSIEATIFKDILLVVGTGLIAYYSYLALIASWTGIVTAATWLWNAAMAANPITWVILAIVALIATLAALWDKFRGFREFVGGVFGAIKQHIKVVIDAFVGLGNVISDVFHGRFKQALEDSKLAVKGFVADITTGMADAIQKGAQAAGDSTFKFSNALTFGGGAGETESQKGEKMFGGKGGGGAVKDSALNTSKLSGASGGLGSAKTINIKIGNMMQIGTIKGSEAKGVADSTGEELLRVINNISASSSGTQ